MKKLIAMLLSLVLCASLLAGCANETTTAQEEAWRSVSSWISFPPISF